VSAFAFFKSKRNYTPNEIAAGYIEAFVNGTLRDPYSWDDFETIPDENPEVDLALHLCWMIARQHQPRHDKEYMAPTGKPGFLVVAGLLRSGKLQPFISLDRKEVLEGNIPKPLSDLLKDEPKTSRLDP
jgi:hypothetical protein